MINTCWSVQEQIISVWSMILERGWRLKSSSFFCTSTCSAFLEAHPSVRWLNKEYLGPKVVLGKSIAQLHIFHPFSLSSSKTPSASIPIHQGQSNFDNSTTAKLMANGYRKNHSRFKKTYVLYLAKLSMKDWSIWLDGFNPLMVAKRLPEIQRSILKSPSGFIWMIPCININSQKCP